jgi:OOP family OmpA-OmpF porin
MSRRFAAAVFLLSLAAGSLAVGADAAHAQSIGDRLKKKAQEKIGEKIDQSGQKKDASDTAAATPAVATPAVATPDAPNAAESMAPGQGAWLNYDFVPGDRTIFFEDFTGNEVGDFPRRLRLQDGNMEVVQIKGQPMLRDVEGGHFVVVLPEKLPPRFTVEIKFRSNVETNPIFLNTTEGPSDRSATLGCYPTSAFVESNNSGGPGRSGSAAPGDAPTWTACTFTVDNGRGIKGYSGQYRTANAPQSHMWQGDTLFVQTPGGSEENPLLIASIRVAAGGKKLYDVLAEKGRVSTQGILFDTGSDRLRPESTPTLAEIGDMLKAHPDLKLAIEGHTDNVGQPAANKTLSEKRAAAVKQYLVSTLGIDASRLTTAGYGDTKPVGPNTTPEGRQNNRRVELVKN